MPGLQAKVRLPRVCFPGAVGAPVRARYRCAAGRPAAHARPSRLPRCSFEGRAACAQYGTNSTCSPALGQAGPCAWWPENNMASLIGAAAIAPWPPLPWLCPWPLPAAPALPVGGVHIICDSTHGHACSASDQWSHLHWPATLSFGCIRTAQPDRPAWRAPSARRHRAAGRPAA